MIISEQLTFHSQYSAKPLFYRFCSRIMRRVLTACEDEDELENLPSHFSHPAMENHQNTTILGMTHTRNRFREQSRAVGEVKACSVGEVSPQTWSRTLTWV